jgi:hypothetical protein
MQDHHSPLYRVHVRPSSCSLFWGQTECCFKPQFKSSQSSVSSIHRYKWANMLSCNACDTVACNAATKSCRHVTDTACSPAAKRYGTANLTYYRCRPIQMLETLIPLPNTQHSSHTSCMLTDGPLKQYILKPHIHWRLPTHSLQVWLPQGTACAGTPTIAAADTHPLPNVLPYPLNNPQAILQHTTQLTAPVWVAAHPRPQRPLPSLGARLP